MTNDQIPMTGSRDGDKRMIAEEMGRLARELTASYEARVSSVEQIIAATHEMLEAFRSQREAMRTRLREALARAASLRRRDFDAMMQGILARQEAREQAIRETMKHYLQEQRTLAATLREALGRGEAQQVGSLKELLEGITARREEREREVRALLADFRKEQEAVVSALRGLVSNGGSIKVKEFKATLRTIQACPRAGREEGGRDGGGQMRLLPGEGARSI